MAMKTCPSCYVELQLAQKNGIEIDYCPQCRGVWLDHGELEKIIERSSQIGAAPANYPPPYPPPAYPSAAAYSSAYPDPHDPGYEEAKATYRMHKKMRKHKHHPLASFLEEVFDVFD